MACRTGSFVRIQNDDGGAQTVEFALLWTFALGPIIYGLIAFGFIMNQQITASQLAREAARSAAICAGTSSQTAAACNTVGQTRFTANKPNGFGGTVVVDTSACFPTATGHDATATVAVSPVLPVPFPSQVTGKATTPCGG